MNELNVKLGNTEGNDFTELKNKDLVKDTTFALQEKQTVLEKYSQRTAVKKRKNTATANTDISIE